MVPMSLSDANSQNPALNNQGRITHVFLAFWNLHQSYRGQAREFSVRLPHLGDAWLVGLAQLKRGLTIQSIARHAG
jgi:hypothetical protein